MALTHDIITKPIHELNIYMVKCWSISLVKNNNNLKYSYDLINFYPCFIFDNVWYICLALLGHGFDPWDYNKTDSHIKDLHGKVLLKPHG